MHLDCITVFIIFQVNGPLFAALLKETGHCDPECVKLFQDGLCWLHVCMPVVYFFSVACVSRCKNMGQLAQDWYWQSDPGSKPASER